ncbi:MAG: DUF3795 domain-containing protein [Dehalococcoidia bacterium]|nr:DUF3795 domain-containing protein [Dehalococcoidia bacterium]
MDKNALAAPCGIHCGLCPLNLAINDERLRNRLSETLQLPPEKVSCTGCRSIDGRCPVIGEQCATWICVRSKGLEFCSECIDFPCVKLMPCSDRAERLPHNIKIASLALRKNKGSFEWEKTIKDVYSRYFHGVMVIGRGPQVKDTSTGKTI